MNRLIRLYPRAWRERYGDEFAALVDDLRAERGGRLTEDLDIARGALDAHLHRRYPMRRFLSDAALRRGALDGLVVAALVTVSIVLTNVVFPPGPDESDSDPEYVVQNLITYGLIAVLFAVIGARGARRTGNLGGGLRAGAVAGFVVALLTIVDFLVVNNLFFSIVSQQHDKIVAYQASGWSSMRAYITVQQLFGALFVVPVAPLVGALLGLVGGAVRLRLRPARA